MANFNKKSLLIFLLLFLMIGLGLIIYTGQKTNVHKKVLSEKEALLVLDYGQDKERWFKGEVIEGMTIFDIFKASSQVGNFNFTTHTHLTTLNGFSNNQEKKWNCYLNNREIKEDLNKAIINPKDKILCQYK